MKTKIFKSIIISVLLLFGCKNKKVELDFTFPNKNEIDIKSKTVELNASLLKMFDLNKLKVFDETNKKELVYQLLDLNADKQIDKIIFQINIPANKTVNIKITQDENIKNFNGNTKVYARFVPERKDDFAWENDKIAYRMFGPALQATGEISNGIDVWVKRTNNLIIDKWYKGEDYHTDHGEGLDYYKVGTSLGCGGSALFENGKLNKSKNFTEWKIIANGPVRTVFELSYAPRKYKSSTIKETKRISLDAGQNLNKIIVSYNVEDVSYRNVIGIVKHSGTDSGATYFDIAKGIFAYWEPTDKEHGNTMTGVYVNPDLIEKFIETKVHYLIVLKETKSNSFEYYSGASWSKSGDYKNLNEWKKYLLSKSYVSKNLNN